MFVLKWIAFLCLAVSALAASLTSRLAEGPQQCEWQRVSGSAGEEARVVLACSLRTAAAATGLLAGLSASQAHSITTLNLHCTDILFFESSLDIGRRKEEGVELLSKFRNLREMTIESCKIRYVPSSVLSPLSQLRTLSLRTHNTDWSAMSMEFHRDSFRGLTDLRSLDLCDNNIWTLPSEIFCPLFNLKELNLTSNRLQDISNMGFSDWGNGPTAPGKSCNSILETLDMSRNEIRNLPDNGLSSLRALQKLFLQNNVISTVADRAFVGLNDLQLLNLSSNSMLALPPEMFQSSRDIKQIYLNNNTISVLAPGLLEGLDQLQILDLSVNNLTSEWVNRDTFSGLIRLIVLNLSHNEISKIDTLLFQDLYNLQFLSLEYNKVSKISEGAFTNLKNLHSLSLAHNKLLEVDSSHFSNLYVLNQLFLDGNKISKIHLRSFENITKLQDLGLSSNGLNEVPDAIKSLRFLRSLDLGSNNITKVSSSQFEGLDDLYGLRLVGNKIVNVSRDTFISLPSLQILNLASNNIDHVDDGAFNSNPTIRAIRLDGNKLLDIKGIFTNMNSLGWLNVSNNNILWFDYSHVPPYLEWLDMHENKIEKLEDSYGMKEKSNVKMLDVSHNNIRYIDEFSFPSTIETIYLNNNELEKINPGTFMQKYNLNKVVLYANKLKTLEIGAFALTPVPEDKDLPEFYIGDNPFFCDCTMEWLQRINELSNQRQRPRVMDLESVKCALAHSRSNNDVLLLNVKSAEFLCSYEAHCFALCHCCDFDACDCKMTCPDKCSCYHDLTWNSNVVDCSNAGYDHVPERIPMDATEIYLDGNDLRDLGNHVFIGKKKLQVLYLNNSNINTIQNRTLNGIESLRVLHLENNNLEMLKSAEFLKLHNLNELYLQQNKIKIIENNTFSSLPALEVLNLNKNGFVDYMPWRVLNENNLKTRISFEGNEWLCECKDIVQLEKWLIGQYKNTNEVMCYFSQGVPSNKSVAIVLKKCREETVTEEPGTENLKRLFVDSSDVVENYIPYIAVVLIVTIVLLLMCALLFMFREEFKLWLHSKYGVRIFSSSGKDLNDHKNKRYDAFVVYSPRDDDFVCRALASELEHSGRSLCLQHRDIQLTERRLSDGLVSAVESSKRLIIVLSISFIQNEWYSPEFKAALLSGINSVNVRQRRQNIIFLVTTDLSAISIEPDLKVLLKTCTVIVWGEKYCWEKLNFRLPDIDTTLPNRTLHNANNMKTLNREAFGHHGGNLRYTAPPTAHDTWYKYGMGSPVLVMASPVHSGSASAEVSARSTEDETCSVASSEGRGDDRLHHSYVSIDNHNLEQRPLRPAALMHAVPPAPYGPRPNNLRKTYFV